VLNELDFSCPHPWIATKHINDSIPDFSQISRKILLDNFTVNLLTEKRQNPAKYPDYQVLS
jgi:hypothetical protein